MNAQPPPAGRLASGQRLGPYEIAAPLAVGGMGEIYRARDVRLGREVAVKILPAALSGDEERLLRFEQERMPSSRVAIASESRVASSRVPRRRWKAIR